MEEKKKFCKDCSWYTKKNKRGWCEYHSLFTARKAMCDNWTEEEDLILLDIDDE